MANLRAIVRATQASALAHKSLAKAARKRADALRLGDVRAAARADATLASARRRIITAGATLGANPLPGDL